MPQRGIEVALDLSRMPAMARRCARMPIPADIKEVLEIAAQRENVCLQVAQTSGVSRETLVFSARFYLQHLLFSPDADHYRVLGLAADASRNDARIHMKLLLEWLHPDRNRDVESVYADRVIDAWQRLSVPHTKVSAQSATSRSGLSSRTELKPPLINMSGATKDLRYSKISRLKLLTAGLMLVLATSSVAYYFGPELLGTIGGWGR